MLASESHDCAASGLRADLIMVDTSPALRAGGSPHLDGRERWSIRTRCESGKRGKTIGQTHYGETCIRFPDEPTAPGAAPQRFEIFHRSCPRRRARAWLRTAYPLEDPGWTVR